MRKFKKACAIAVALTMTISVAMPIAGATKVKISNKKITLEVGKSKTLTVKKGKKKVKKVKWSTSNKKVATVKKGKVTGKSAGTATITAKVGKKSYKCKVTVKAKKTPTTTAAAPENTTAATEPTTSVVEPTTGTVTEPTTSVVEPTTATVTEPTTSVAEPTTSAAEEETTVSENGFSFKNDVEIETGTITKYIEFQLKTTNGKVDPEEVKELESIGCTVDVEKGIAYKNQVCESVKYTFKKLPTTLEEIQSFFDEPEYQDDVDSQTTGELNYGGFNAMAATICAACTFKGGSNPSDPFFSKDPVRDMFEYINGPATSMNIAKAQMDNAISSMKSAIQACGPNVYKSYFNGATEKNDYTPSEPYVLEMYKGPYYIESKQTINGTRPTTYMILVKSGGADAERYIDVYYSTKMKRWFSYENQFMHIIANDFRAPEEEL